MGLGEFVVTQTFTYSWRVTNKVANKVFYEYPIKGFRALVGTSDQESTELRYILLFAHVLSCMIDVTYDIAKYGCKHESATSTKSMRAVQESGFVKLSANEICRTRAPNQSRTADELRDPNARTVRDLLIDPLCHVTVFRRLGRARGEPDRIVVAIRGTRLTSLLDLMEDATLSMERLHKSDRVAKIRKLVLLLIEKYGRESVVITGHSLGAAIGFLVARQLHLEGEEVEGHFFELPFLPLDKIYEKIVAVWEWEMAVLKKAVDILHLNSRIEEMWGAIATGTARLLSFNVDAAQKEFNELADWHPYIYVQQYDHIANGYIEFFKHNSAGHNGISRSTSILHKLGLPFGLDPKARHLCPSAILITSDVGLGTLTSHGVSKWMNAEPLRVEAVQYTKLRQVRVLS